MGGHQALSLTGAALFLMRTKQAAGPFLLALGGFQPLAMSCLALKLVLRQEYLSADLAALPVFKLSLVISGCLCAKEGVISLQHDLVPISHSPSPSGEETQRFTPGCYEKNYQTLSLRYCALLYHVLRCLFPVSILFFMMK